MSGPSLLADNPSARIEIVQGGGGMEGTMKGGFTESELKVLTQYGLQPGGRFDSEISPEIKKQFLEQLSKSNCEIGTGDNVILNSECSAVAQVIGAMIKATMKRTNGWEPKSLKLAAKPPAPPGAVPSTVAPPPVPGRPIDTSALLATIRSRINGPHAGLNNCGNTCYLNSVIQMLSYVPEFVDESSKNEGLYSIFRDLYSTTGSVNLQLNNRLQSVFGGIFPLLTEQHDATDFIRGLNAKFNFTSPYFNITQIDTTSCTYEPSPELGLPERTPVKTSIPHILLDINNGTSIEGLINYRYQPVSVENIENCITPDNDDLRGPATQITSYEIPDENRYAIISLLRFRDTGRRDGHGKIIYEKLDKHIEITPEIRLGGVEYNLYGVVLHDGSLNGGHYRFLKIKSDLASGIMYNDTSVTEIANTDDMNQNTYIAIYRRDTIPVRVAAAPEAPVEAAPEAEAAPVEAAPVAAPEAEAAPVEAAPVAAPEAEAAPEAGPGVIGSMPNLHNAPNSLNENAPNDPEVLEAYVDILMELEPTLRKRRAREGVEKRVSSVREAINRLPDNNPSKLTRDDIDTYGNIKPERINTIMENFRNYSKNDLLSVLHVVNKICMGILRDGGSLNGINNERIKELLLNIELQLRKLHILENNIKQHFRMSAAAPEPANLPAAANVNYPDEFYEENPSNFQDGHLRVNFKKEGLEAPGNRRVYANTVVGTRRTRIYGTNAANIKKKYDARTRKLKAAANRAATEAKAAANAVEQARKKSLEAEAAKKAVELAGKKAREEAARQAKEAAQAQNAQRKAEAAVAAANKKTAEAAAAAAAKAERAAKIASGEIKPSFFNRFRGGRRTRRKTRGSRKSRRGGRK